MFIFVSYEEGYSAIDASEADEWSSAECIARYETSKCAEWKRGRCNGEARPLLRKPLKQIIEFQSTFFYTAPIPTKGPDRP